MQKQMNNNNSIALSAAEYRRMQEIEGNPYTPQDEAMFEMFDRKGLSTEQRIEYLNERAAELTGTPKAGD
jgi:predicted metal-dependent phosphoesterase TrpH